MSSTVIESDLPNLAVSQRLRPIVEELTKSIRGGKFRPGDRLPAIRELATTYGVSASSVLLVVEQLEKMGLVQRMHGSGTYVKQVPAERRAADLTYLFLDGRAHVLGDLAHELVEQLQAVRILPIKAFWQRDGSVEQIDHLVERWCKEPPRAIVVHGLVAQEFEKVLRVACPPQTRIIDFFVVQQLCPTGWHSVNADNRAAVSMATEYLIQQGHRRIGFLTKMRTLIANWRHTSRKAFMRHTEEILGMGHTLEDAGIKHGLTVHYNVPVQGDPSGIPVDEENVKRMAQWLAKPNRPTAVIGEEFRLAGLKLAAKQLGLRIPQDLAWVGISGGSGADRSSDYPQVSLRYDLVAREIASLISVDSAELGQAARHVVVPPQFLAGTNSSHPIAADGADPQEQAR